MPGGAKRNQEAGTGSKDNISFFSFTTVPPSSASCYNSLEMKDRVKALGYILIGLGTLGLLLNEFALEGLTAFTLTATGVDIIGFALLIVGRYAFRGPESNRQS